MNAHAPLQRRSQAGMTLMELMIAITIGLFLLVGLSAVFVTSNRNYADLSRASQQIENGRFAVQIVSDDVAVAGFYGRYFGTLTVPALLPDPCLVAASDLRSATPFPLQGYDAPASSPISCIDDDDHLDGTDMLVVRRADSTIAGGNHAKATPISGLSATQMYLQANADSTSGANPIIALGSNPAASFPLLNRDANNWAPVRRYHVHIYFIAPCSIPNGGGTSCTGAADDGGSPIPTLKRLELSDGAFSVVSLVEGIENFQVDYGIDSDGDGVPNSYLTTAATVPDWANVVAVRLNILARNLERSSDYTDTKVYDMGVAGTVTPGGPYKRHVYNSVIRVVNPSSKRES